MSALFDQQNPYGQASGYGGSGVGGGGYGGQAGAGGAGGNSNLQFYSGGGGTAGGGYDSYASGSGGRSSLEGNMGSGFGGSAADRSLLNSQMGFWSAFGTGGFPDEPSLMEGMWHGFFPLSFRTPCSPLLPLPFALRAWRQYSPHHRQEHDRAQPSAQLFGPPCA